MDIPSTSEEHNPVPQQSAIKATASTSAQTPDSINVSCLTSLQKGLSTVKGHIKKNFVTNEVAALQSKIKKLQKSKESYMTRLKKTIKLSENPAFLKALKNFTTMATIFTMLQFREAGKPRTGRRYTKEEKVMALSLYKQGPRAYRWWKKHVVLPSPLTLSRMVTRASIRPGINENIFRQLKKRVSKMTNTEKLCILLFDEMALSPHFDYIRRNDEISGFVNNGKTKKLQIADHALVFMIRGIQKNYKQPIAYSFCSATTPTTDLVFQIKSIIKKLNSVGLKVVATICDQGSTNVSAINWLINETRQNYLREGKTFKNQIFEIDGEEVVPLYDTPHLIKGIRNNLLNKDLKANINGKEKTAKWEHIIQLYKENPAYQGIRLMPKLTENHVLPKKISKMKVKCATQVFSRSVAANMGYLSSIGILSKECQDTADVIIFFDSLFDSLNGSFDNHKKRSGKPLLGPVTPHSQHKKEWSKAKNILRSMKFVDSKGIRTASVPSLKNWLTTIENIEYLVFVLSKKYNLTSLWMRHFNQDPLENFFGCIRSHGYRNNMPTCAGFEVAFAALLINNLSSLHSPGANCEYDDCKIFKTLNTLFFDEPEMSSCTAEVDFEDCNSDDIFVCLSEKRKDPKIRAQLEYVTGYVLKKNYKKKCETCKESLFDRSKESIIQIREFFDNKKCLTYPSQALLKCFSHIQDVVIRIIQNDSRKNNIQAYIKTILSIVIDYSFINCVEHKADIIKKLENVSLNLFIYNWCKDTNKILAGSRSDYDSRDEVQLLAFNYCKKRFRNK
ncbi:hypothetical protein ABMA27_001275 [Loxostege sticticalis]